MGGNEVGPRSRRAAGGDGDGGEEPASPGSPVRAVWADFGGVLTAPGEQTLPGFCRRIGAEPAQLLAAMATVARTFGTDDIMEPLDTPLVGPEVWAAQIERELAERHGVAADLSDFGLKWFDGRPANAALVDYLGALRERGYFVGMLSNMPPAFEPHWRRMVMADELFDDLVLSYEVGCRKPQRRIYELAALRAYVAARHCVLIDDLAQNCDGARAAGWQAIQHDDTRATIERLERLLA